MKICFTGGDIRSFSNNIMTDLFRQCDNDVESFAKNRLLDRHLKKFVVQDPKLSEVALHTFLLCNKECASISIDESLVLRDPVFGEARDFIYEALRRFTKKNSEDVHSSLDMSLLLSLWKFGPGASQGVSGTHFVEKIAEDMTTTLAAAPLVKMIRSITPRLNAYDKRMGRCGITVVSGSRTSAVPKNTDTDRLIATEPSGNMACQLAAGMYIEGALRCVGLDISTETGQSFFNNMLAMLGSIDGLIATVDLKSASDLIRPTLIKMLWPEQWYDLFLTIRSPVTEIPMIDENGDKCFGEVELNMMSTMGNGFTFPMMTLTLLALCYGVTRVYSDAKLYTINYNNVGVFGDDIIFPSTLFKELSETLSKAGLKVNHDKSYSEGPFRESCGGDYYAGVDVTPFYVKSLETEAEVYVAINQCLSWSSRFFPLWNTLDYLFSLSKGRFVVPEWEDPSSGILSTVGPRYFKKLVPVPLKRVVRQNYYDADLHVLCALGGYLESNISGSSSITDESLRREKPRRANSYFLPRTKQVMYRVEKCKIPRGFLNGRHHITYDDVRSNKIARLVEILLS